MLTPRGIIRSFATVTTALLLLTAVGPADAALFGKLETPSGAASGIGSVQGWVYTTTPGASLVQPFEVYVNGVRAMSVPCCSERGDVRDIHPEAPLRSGFSGTTNWAREAGRGPVTVEVVVRDTAGDEIVLMNADVEIHAWTTTPYSLTTEWADDEEGLIAPLEPTSHVVTGIPSWCALSNDGPEGEAELACTNLTSSSRLGEEMCDGVVRYTWSRSTQALRQSSSCEYVERWIDNGNGTATDMRTGLVWEILTPVDRFLQYAWAADGAGVPNGSAFYGKIGAANGAGGGGCAECGCLGGFCDWRLPTAEELLTIVDVRACEGPLEPCTTIPGTTSPGSYWSVTTSPRASDSAVAVDFGAADLAVYPKTHELSVRLVRGAMPRMVSVPKPGTALRRIPELGDLGGELLAPR